MTRNEKVSHGLQQRSTVGVTRDMKANGRLNVMVCFMEMLTAMHLEYVYLNCLFEPTPHLISESTSQHTVKRPGLVSLQLVAIKHDVQVLTRI